MGGHFLADKIGKTGESTESYFPKYLTYSSQQHEKAERQQKTSRVQFCSNLVPNHFTGLSVAPRSLADSVHGFDYILGIFEKRPQGSDEVKNCIQGPRLKAWTRKSPIRGNHWVDGYP